MLTTIKGTFRDGQINLSEDPGFRGEAEVYVTFVTEPRPRPDSQMMTFGMLAVPGRRMSTEEDFKIAEYHGEAEAELDDAEGQANP